MAFPRGLAVTLAGLAAGCTGTAQRLSQEGLAAYEQGKYVQALSYFQEALEYEPGDADIVFNLASCHHRLGNRSKAEETYRRCLKIAPSHLKACRGLAVLLLEQGYKGEARELVEEFRARAPDQAAGWLAVAWFYYLTGEPTRARGMVHRAREFSPDDAEAAALLGDIHRALGQKSEALAAYRESLALKPGQKSVERKLAALEKEAGGRP